MNVRENADTLRDLESDYRGLWVAGTWLVGMLVSASVILALAWSEYIELAVGAALVSAAGGLAASTLARHPARFDRWVVAAIGAGTYDELVLNSELPAAARTGRYAAGGAVERRLLELRGLVARWRRVSSTLRMTNVIVAAATIVLLALAGVDDANRSRVHTFDVAWVAQIDPIVNRPKAPIPAFPPNTAPDTGAPGAGASSDSPGIRAGDMAPEATKPTGDSTASVPTGDATTDQRQSPTLASSSTPSAVTHSMRAVDAIGRLRSIRADLGNWNAARSGATQLPGDALEAAKDAKNNLDKALDDVTQSPLIPADLKERIKDVQSKGNAFWDALAAAAESPSPERIVAAINALADLLSSLDRLLEGLEAWARGIESFLKDLLGSESGFSQKVQDISREASERLRAGSSKAAAASLAKLEQRLSQEMARIQVRVDGVPPASNTDTAGGGTTSPNDRGDATAGSSGRSGDRRAGDPDAVQSEEKLRNRGRGVSEYPSSAGN